MDMSGNCKLLSMPPSTDMATLVPYIEKLVSYNVILNLYFATPIRYIENNVSYILKGINILIIRIHIRIYDLIYGYLDTSY
jgi:hypothetical protein